MSKSIVMLLSTSFVILAIGVFSYANDGTVYVEKDLPEVISDIKDIADWDIAFETPMTSSICLADVDGDGIKEIVATTYGPQPNPYQAGAIHIVSLDGVELDGWPYNTSEPFSTSAVVGDVDNDGDMEIAAGDWSLMYLFNHDGTSYPGWPQYNGINCAPTMADLDGNGDLEIIYPSNNILYIRNHDGSYFEGFPVSAPDNIGSPAIGDIDNDGQLEIVSGTLAGGVGPDPYEIYAWETDGSVITGFPIATSGVVKSTPALGDVNNDGYLEIVVAAYHTSNLDYIYCVDYQGNALPGWPIRADYVRLSSPALADIDNNGTLEIFIGGLVTSGGFVEMIYGFDHEGSQLDNWPIPLNHDGGAGNINSSPIVAEVDDESDSPEIFVRTYNNIFGLNADGSYMTGFPYAINDDNSSGTHTPSPAIDDMDGDGDADMIFATPSGRIYYVDWSGTFNAERTDWPMYKHDQWGLSRWGGDIGTGVDEQIELPVSTELMVNYPNPFNAKTTISFTLEKQRQVNLSIYNLLGRKVSTLVEGKLVAGSHIAMFDASELPSGIYFYKLVAGDQEMTNRMILLK